MGVILHQLILNKEVRPLCLPYVMIIRSNPDQEGISADCLCSRLCQITHDDAVMISAWRFHEESSQ